ncbi:MAG: hypothetical protein RL682_2185 [Pseudomonadota bacterium]|jgi:hypothetical protein
MTKRLTREQTELYVGPSTCMTIAFAVGVFEGTIGGVLLLWRKPLASPVY